MRKRKAISELGESSSPTDENDTENSEINFKMESNIELDYKQQENGQKVTPILEQERFLPMSNVGRIMKRVLPQEGKLSKEAKECMQECITEFLQFITSEASDKCASEKRKTITGEDLLFSFAKLGFDEYVEPLRVFLYKYRDAHKIKSYEEKNGEIPAASKHDFLEGLHEARVDEVDYINQHEPSHQIYTTPSNTNSNQENGLIDSSAVPGPSTSSATSSAMPQQYITQQQSSALQPLPVFYDPNTRQHYLSLPSSDGTQSLHPINLTAAGGSINLGTNVIQAVETSTDTDSSNYRPNHSEL